jgi:hypothetical protein
MASNTPTQRAAPAPQNGGRMHHGPRHRLQKFLIPAPKLEPPISPAQVEHERERAEAAQNRVADKITTFARETP